MTCIVVVMLMLTVSAQVKNGALPSSPDDLLDRQVPGGEMEYLPTSQAFYFSLSRAKVPGVMARVDNCEKDEPKQIWRPMLPLRDVLDVIVAADPRYRWHIEDGVVNLLPAAGEPALLQIRIPRLRVQNVTSAKDALHHLLALDEVKKGMEEQQLKPGISVFVSGETANPKAFSVHCRNVTLREALNAIARAQGRATWDYIETHCEGRNEVIIRF